MKFEQGFLRQESNELMDKAYEEAKRVIARDQISLDDFEGKADGVRLAKDRAYVADRRKKFEAQDNDPSDPTYAENRKWATVFEAFLHMHIEQSNYFGENASTVKTSEYDDYQGIDEVVEFSQDQLKSHLGMAVDVTFNKNPKYKIDRIRRKIDAGELDTVRYFISPDGDFQGELRNIPHVVVGADRKTIAELSELWLQNSSKALAEHSIQFQLLEQILEQCHIYEQYARKKGQEAIAEKYLGAGELISAVMLEKRESMNDHGQRDSVHHSLMAEVRRFGKE